MTNAPQAFPLVRNPRGMREAQSEGTTVMPNGDPLSGENTGPAKITFIPQGFPQVIPTPAPLPMSWELPAPTVTFIPAPSQMPWELARVPGSDGCPVFTALDPQLDPQSALLQAILERLDAIEGLLEKGRYAHGDA